MQFLPSIRGSTLKQPPEFDLHTRHSQHDIDESTEQSGPLLFGDERVSHCSCCYVMI